LAALLLSGTEPKHGFFFTAFNRAVDRSTEAYKQSLRWLFGRRLLMIGLFLAMLGLGYYIYSRVPRGFVPSEDQGYMIVIVQAPQGASLEYTAGINRQVEQILRAEQEIRGVFCVAGFSFAGSAPNRGIVFANFKPFSERQGKGQTGPEIVDRVRPKLFGISGGMAIAFAPPAVQGLGTFGGFQYVLQDQGGHTFEELAQVQQAIIAEGNKSGVVTGLFSPFTANDPQYLVTIDREKAKSLQVPLRQITDALQIYLGSQYVNDFDFNNRSYRVYVQADRSFRAQPKDIRQYYVRSDSGEMIALDNLVQVKETTTPPVVGHYNLFRSVDISGSAALGRSSGEAIAAMEEISRRVLPRGFSFEWTGISREEIESGRQALILFVLGFVFVYLTLAAQYESFSLPFIVLLAVPAALMGAMALQWARGLQNDVYAQIGLVMLIALASKNSILIVEFAEQLREKGMSVQEAAVEAAKIRLRPILMTSFTLILGVLPLVTATGAGSAGRQSVGTTVFGGMLISTILNIFFIPVLYIAFKGWREKRAAS